MPRPMESSLTRGQRTDINTSGGERARGLSRSLVPSPHQVQRYRPRIACASPKRGRPTDGTKPPHLLQRSITTYPPAHGEGLLLPASLPPDNSLAVAAAQGPAPCAGAFPIRLTPTATQQGRNPAERSSVQALRRSRHAVCAPAWGGPGEGEAAPIPTLYRAYPIPGRQVPSVPPTGFEPVASALRGQHPKPTRPWGHTGVKTFQPYSHDRSHPGFYLMSARCLRAIRGARFVPNLLPEASGVAIRAYSLSPLPGRGSRAGDRQGASGPWHEAFGLDE